MTTNIRVVDFCVCNWKGVEINSIQWKLIVGGESGELLGVY